MDPIKLLTNTIDFTLFGYLREVLGMNRGLGYYSTFWALCLFLPSVC